MTKAVELELFTNRFRALVAEMGERLERTAISVNVKERKDFSCGLLDPNGRLVVNAPHIPVHLGALGLCVRSVGAELEWRPGDVVVTNHPEFGGSHLPDVTVITPVFGRGEPDGGPLGFVASRAHHAEIGGSRPGSMPPDATSLAQEGVVLTPFRLADRGAFAWEEARRLLSTGPFPSRAVAENLADLAAAVAANHRGAELLRELAGRHGRRRLRQHMQALARQAGASLAAALEAFAPGRYEAEEFLDDGAPLRVAIDLAPRRRPGQPLVRIDFAGSSGVHPGNLNATPAIVRSAVLYVLRLLVVEPLPLNEGLLENVELVVPPGILNPGFGPRPETAPAVVGGNVETSQRLVDTMLKALGVGACSQGTMNNIVFGSETFSYYETLGGGCGATAEGDGASALHSHMTNTAITDPEVLESRYPVRLERFAVRRGSGGAGRFRGGDGLIRELTFLEPLKLSVLTQHRVVPPYGLDGGSAGAVGRQFVRRSGGQRDDLASVDSCDVFPGDRLIVETPGGGGWGSK